VGAPAQQPWPHDALPLSPRLWLADGEIEKIEVPLVQRSGLEGVRLPVPVALVSSRIGAAVFDGLAISCGALLFAGVCLALLGRPELDHAFVIRRLVPALAGVATLLPVPYILGSFYLCGRTPGMRFAHLLVLTYDGMPANGRILRRRAWASLLSLGALGLGYWWVLVDEDRLTWHDHLSETYVTSVRVDSR
jgi:uncharacterized RDD family membrane protein YckC